MGHPLTPNLREMSMEDLTKKIGDLNSRFSSAFNMGRTDHIYQLQMILQDYNEELQRRNQEQLAELEKNSKNFSKIIDIK
jgi:hypothetical protein